MRGASLWAAEEEPGVIEQEVFAMLDVNGDGHVSLEEMAPLLDMNSSRACAVMAQMRRCRAPQAGFTPREFAAAFREDNRVVEFYQEKFHESMDAPDASATLAGEWLQTLPAEQSSQQRRSTRKRAPRVAKKVAPVGHAHPKGTDEVVGKAKWQEADTRRWVVKKQCPPDEATLEPSLTPRDERQFRQRRRTAPAGSAIPDLTIAAVREGGDTGDSEEDEGTGSAAVRRTWRPVFKPRRRSCLGASEIAAEVAAEEVAAESTRQPSAHLDLVAPPILAAPPMLAAPILAAPSMQQVADLQCKLEQSQAENASLCSMITHLRAEVAALRTRNAAKQPPTTPTREVLAAASDAAATVQQSRWRIINPTTGEEVVAPDSSVGAQDSERPSSEERQVAERALEGGSAAETLGGLIFEPSFGTSWDWPLSRQEKKERILMINQIQLLDEIEELRSRATTGDSDEIPTCC